MREMFALSLEPALRQLTRVMTCDITRVYRLPLQRRHAPPAGAESWTYRFLDADTLAHWINREDLELGRGQLEDLRSGEARCFAAFREGAKGDEGHGEPGGYAWFAEHCVAPRHNTGGAGFAGIGLSLPPGVAFTFKCFVSPRFRGKALMSRLLHEAASALEIEGCRELVTTTDIGNRAFQQSAERIGFEHVGHAAEFVVFGRHLFHLPRRDDHIGFHAGCAS